MPTLFTPFRSQAEATAAVGRQCSYRGERYQCTGFNDLGALYWSRVTPKGVARKQVYGECLDKAAGA